MFDGRLERYYMGWFYAIIAVSVFCGAAFAIGCFYFFPWLFRHLLIHWR